MTSKALLKHVFSEISLPARKISEEDYKKNVKWIEDFKVDSTNTRQYERCKDIVSRYEDQQKGIERFIPVEIHVIRLGEIAFATNPFELFLDYGIRIQARSPATQTFLVQLAGKGVPLGGTYLATERAEAGEGYSASVYCNQVGFQGGNKLVDETVKMIESTWGEVKGENEN
ncbi:MAG TPA: hypothetical protein PK821_07900, partial [Victivallales bacterium]|nr:hypothetical protein [Victivallales bacterium]